MAKIRSDIETLRATDTGSALGQIWIEFSDRALPCPQWDNFIVFVLDWWRWGIRNILTGAKEPGIFAFMDDPYEITVTPVPGGLDYICTFHEKEHASGNEQGEGVTELLTSYCAVVRAVIERVEQDPDWRKTYDGCLSQLENLKTELPRFESLLKNYKQSRGQAAAQSGETDLNP